MGTLKKLTLKKEIIANLDNNEMNELKGGGTCPGGDWFCGGSGTCDYYRCKPWVEPDTYINCISVERTPQTVCILPEVVITPGEEWDTITPGEEEEG
ncbi:MAG: class I lanthipeptide [Dysgonamonadaceae bacterium]|nr:class I lanthipeptide [Dysgonamonadaceae bacterium]